MDRTYSLSRNYRDLFSATYRFCGDMVESGQHLGRRQQRVRYWAALALLRCVMSSPAAAVAALESRQSMLPEESEDDAVFRPFIYESSEDQTDDGQPTPPIEAAEPSLPTSDKRRLGELRRMAEALQNPRGDTKLAKSTELVSELLR
ncbi:MAG TPA: hypothetical protein VLX90_14400, partial [Steroidobacteraceae bacterium]|nr:hypothetical protein [Steroidobacteraceae bacterium]